MAVLEDKKAISTDNLNGKSNLISGLFNMSYNFEIYLPLNLKN